MKQKIVFAMVVVGMMGLAVSIAAKAPPKKVVIDACKKKKPAVAFDHEAHSKKLKIKCVTCHHTGKQQKCATSGCHGPKKEGKKLGCGEASLKKNPYHINCAGCHKKQKKGPKSCKGCHKK